MNVRTLFWLPYHHPTLKPLDEHTLRSMSTTVSLSPTMAASIVDDLPCRDIMTLPEYNEQRASRKVLGIPEDAFVVLAQGGNYEEYDRGMKSDLAVICKVLQDSSERISLHSCHRMACYCGD